MIKLSADADKLLEELKCWEVKLLVVGERLKVEGELPEDLKNRIRAHEKELILLVKLGEHRWRQAEEWVFHREGSRMTGKRLDVPGEMSWEVTPSTSVKGNPSKQLALTGASK